MKYSVEIHIDHNEVRHVQSPVGSSGDLPPILGVSALLQSTLPRGGASSVILLTPPTACELYMSASNES